MAAPARVLLVHGLWYGRPSMLPLAGRLQKRGWNCTLFGYSSVFGRATENIARLAERAAGVDGDPLHFVGHSLGGLLILEMLAGSGGSLPGGRVVLLGSPLNGSTVARRMAGNRVLKPSIGRAEALLDQGMEHLPEGREVAAIAGTSSLGAGRLVARLPRPHDGTVSVAETKLQGLADHLGLPVSHTGLVLSGAVAKAVHRFLAEGRLRADV